MDVLSEVLKAVALEGAVFYNAKYSAPWAFRSPASRLIAPYFGSRTGHVIMYHLVTDGHAWAELEGGPRIHLTPGDIVIFPHGDPHLMGNGRPAIAIDNGLEIDSILSQGLRLSEMGGGGAVTKFVCGYMMCDPQVSRMLLAGLPRVFTINIRNDPSGAWLENTIRFSVDNAGSSTAGGEAVLAKLSEALFIETLRRYMDLLPPAQRGWLAGARDAEVGKALSLLHQQPAEPWTIGFLAKQVGVSRAVLAERFRHFLGEPPITYLTRWRLQLAGRLLTTTSQSVAEIAPQVGYDSEAAFNRAFKRMFQVPPARFRRESKSVVETREVTAKAA